MKRRQLSTEYNLQAINPLLAQEWHPAKNGGLTPEDVTFGSNKKVWWQCGKGHAWQAVVGSRRNGVGCPYCSGRRATKETSLAVKNPQLASE